MNTNEKAGGVPTAPGHGEDPMTDNVITLPTRKQPDGTPVPIVLGGGRVFHCGRCARTFTAQTWHCIENMREDADGLAHHTDVCRRCAFADPILSNWANLCDVLDSIDGLMQDAVDQRARNVLQALITRAAEHFAVWRWPEDQPPYIPGDEDEDEDEADEL